MHRNVRHSRLPEADAPAYAIRLNTKQDMAASHCAEDAASRRKALQQRLASRRAPKAGLLDALGTFRAYSSRSRPISSAMVSALRKKGSIMLHTLGMRMIPKANAYANRLVRILLSSVFR